jgi:hypothetical protein
VRSLKPAAKKVRGAALAALNAPDWLAGRYQGTDKMAHGYIAHYRRVLGPRRFRKLTVFEIGVGGFRLAEPGGSLQLWRDYFPRSTVVGLDIVEKTVSYGPRVSFARVDQSSVADLQRVVAEYGSPDVVIDDGSHVGEHQIISFECLWSTLTSGGIYVIEDLATSYGPEYGGAEPAPERSGVGLIERLVTDVQSRDPYFQWSDACSPAPAARYPAVASVLTFPGITFIEKA